MKYLSRVRAVLWIGGLFFGLAVGTAHAQPVYVNEFMASNRSTVTDPDFGEAADWLELHNAGAADVDLNGYTLTDDLEEPAKWRIETPIVVPPGGFVVLWADGEEQGRHAGFKLSADGEQIGLYDAAGAVVDTVTFGAQTPDVSRGRVPDGGAAWRFFGTPTPGAANPSGGATAVAPPPSFSVPGGLYDDGLAVSLYTELPEAVIRYTRDGTPPDEDAPVYTDPLHLDAATVLRAAVFKEGFLRGPVVTHSYLVGERGGLPVVSLATDPAHFFSDETGIYVQGTNGVPGYCRSEPHNWNRDWERPVHVEFFEPEGQPGFRLEAGVKIFGGCGRIYPQKSLALYARKEYGPARIDYPVFPDLPFDSYNNLVLRSGSQDWWRALLRDGLVHTLVRDRMNLDVQAFRPAIVFLNGQYWGIHNLREKLNEHYVEAHHGVDPDQVDILKGNGQVQEGEAAAYEELMAFVTSSDLADPEQYARLQEMMEVDEYIDYMIAEIYSANYDWPGNNTRFWRPRTPEGRWRWMLFDLDLGLGAHHSKQYATNTLAVATDTDGPDYPNPPWSTLLFRHVLESPAFRDEFVQRFAVHLNTTFAPERVVHVLDSLQAHIAPEIPRHEGRWPQSLSLGGNDWQDHVEIVREFARQRPGWIRRHVVDHFGLSRSVRLEIGTNDPAGGHVVAHGVALPPLPFGPILFEGVPVRLRAVPAPGYTFVGWQGLSDARTDTVTVVPGDEGRLTARFEPSGVDVGDAGPSPARTALLRPYPNPSGGETTITFELARPGPVSLRLYDLLGREVALLVDGQRRAGRHRLTFAAGGLPAGTYYGVLRAAGTTDVQALVVVR